MEIDLKKDFELVLRFFKKQIEDRINMKSQCLGDASDKVSVIHIGYDVDDTSWLALVFDNRTDAAPDGAWHDLIEPNKIEMGHWSNALDLAYETGERLKILNLTGEKVEISPDDEEAVVASFGLFIKEVVCFAMNNSYFKSLPRQANAYVTIENYHGRWSWPEHNNEHKRSKISA